MVSRGGTLNTSAGGWGYGGPADVINVRVNRRVALLAVGVHVPIGSASFDISVWDATRKLPGSNLIKLEGREEARSPTRVPFASSIPLEPNKWYTVAVLQKGKNTPSVSTCSSRVVSAGVEWQFATV